MCLWGVDMLNKYYSFNLVNRSGEKAGSYVIRVRFWVSPLNAIEEAKNLKPSGNVFITDFKRIK